MASEGFPARVRNIIHSRSDYAGIPTCEVNVQCYLAPATQIHHRRPRGMGGSKRVDTNTASNGLDVCHSCHEYIESHREEALGQGWLLPQHAVNPSIHPVHLRGWTVYLDDDGQKLAQPFSDNIQPLVPGVTNA
jgi:5-methylcytosine-specific restriction enzyme A